MNDEPIDGPGDYLITIARRRGDKTTYIHLEISADDEDDARSKAWDYCRERDKENPRYVHSPVTIQKVPSKE